MLLKGKNAVIYGAGGAIGGAVARTFAGEGARVFLAGRTRASLDAVPDGMTAVGGVGEISEVDALDEFAVERHTQHIVQEAGRIDVSFNLIGVPLGQGTPLADLPIDDFTVPIAAYMRTHLLTARAAARHMLEAGSGVILMMTTTPDRLAIPFVGPFGVMCAAVEALSRTLAAELGRMAFASSACGRPGHRRPPACNGRSPATLRRRARPGMSSRKRWRTGRCSGVSRHSRRSLTWLPSWPPIERAPPRRPPPISPAASWSTKELATTPLANPRDRRRTEPHA